MPPILSYMGSTLAADDHSPWWQVFNTEWAAMVAYEMMYQARRGRLHFITPTLREAIRTIGCRAIMQNDTGLGAQLQALVREVELIRWSLVSPRNRSLPGHAGSLFVSITGNWVAFNAEAWETQMDDEMYVEEGDDERALYSPDHPEGSLTGYIDQAAEEMRATRPTSASADFEVPVSTAGEAAEPQRPVNTALRVLSDAMPTAKQQARAARVLNKVLDHAGLTQLLDEYGYTNGLSLDNIADILRIFLNERERIRLGQPKVEPTTAERVLTIAEELDLMEAARQRAKEEAVKVKVEPSTEPPAKRLRREASQEAGVASKPSASTNKAVGTPVLDLLSDDESDEDNIQPTGTASQW